VWAWASRALHRIANPAISIQSKRTSTPQKHKHPWIAAAEKMGEGATVAAGGNGGGGGGGGGGG